MAAATIHQGRNAVTADRALAVPDHPIIPFIEGDGTGPDIWRASVRVFDAAVAKASDGKKRIAAYQNMQAEFRKDSPFIMLFQHTEVAAYRSHVQGVKLGPTYDPPYLYKVSS